jgi:hypothetical protein
VCTHICAYMHVDEMFIWKNYISFNCWCYNKYVGHVSRFKEIIDTIMPQAHRVTRFCVALYVPNAWNAIQSQRRSKRYKSERIRGRIRSLVKNTPSIPSFVPSFFIFTVHSLFTRSPLSLVVSQWCRDRQNFNLNKFAQIFIKCDKCDLICNLIFSSICK